MYLPRDDTKSREEIGKLLEGGEDPEYADGSFNPVETLDTVALNSSSPLYPNRLSVFDLCDEARETLSDNAAANIVNDNLTGVPPDAIGPILSMLKHNAKYIVG